ncbi:ribonuclease III [Candidatus Gracilibacteria bacterium]|nr:ribonuclease III [Candidatus Gracilibacteria bacterium]
MVITKKAIDNPKSQQKIQKLLENLEIDFSDIKLFVLSFIHRSIVNERTDFAPEHNERLEFLGDAVLELAITRKLYSDFPEKPEGEMTDMRSALVRGRNLAEVAKQLCFQEYLFLGKGEEKSGGRENDYILANTLEAFLGALYLDKRYETTENFILKYIYATLPNIEKNNLFKDFKTLLQEFTQAHKDITPHYEVLQDSGPDHDKSFLVGVFLKTQKIGEGTGSSKKKAQESAAENAYSLLISK